VKNAFDSIQHERLVYILENHLGPTKNWRDIAITEWMLLNGRMKKRSRVSFSRSLKPNTILFSRVLNKSPTYSTAQLLLVIQRVLQQRLSVCGKRYTMRNGLCQGGAGPLSTRLCDVYLSAMDHQFLLPITKSLPKDSILVRARDDYLFVSNNRSKALMFYDLLARKSITDKYNIVFNEDKMVTNLFQKLPGLKFLGLSFNFETFAVSPSYHEFLFSSPLTLMKFNFNPKLSQFDSFSKKCCVFTSLKLKSIIFVENNNSFVHLQEIVKNACSVLSLRILSLAIRMSVSSTAVLLVLATVEKKIVNLFLRWTFSSALSFIRYTFWKAVMNAFNPHKTQFPGIYKPLKNFLKYYRHLSM